MKHQLKDFVYGIDLCMFGSWMNAVMSPITIFVEQYQLMAPSEIFLWKGIHSTS